MQQSYISCRKHLQQLIYTHGCCGLTWLVAEHHTVLRSLPPLPREMGERIEKKKKPNKLELGCWDKTIY